MFDWMNKISVSDVISSLAFVISLVSANYARQQARHAARQANAAFGDIDPVFKIEYRSSRITKLDTFLICQNFNKNSLRIIDFSIFIDDGHALDTGPLSFEHWLKDPITRDRYVRNVFKHTVDKNLAGFISGAGKPATYIFPFRISKIERDINPDRTTVLYAPKSAPQYYEVSFEVNYIILDGKNEMINARGKSGFKNKNLK